MDQLTKLWNNLTWPQRIWLFIAALAVAGGVTWFSRWNEERDFKPLYSNLSAEDAGGLATKLKETAMDYRLGEGGATILVPSARVAEARLAMAAQGLPKSGRIGYELFDKANFGASDFAEQVNYHRAIEGELERSIMSLREVEQARVHITLAKDSIYTEARQPAKASILLKLRAGSRLSPANVGAICQLAASAVPELAPEQVTLVDTSGNLLNRARKAAVSEDDSEAALDYRRSVEKDIQNKIAATLEPLVGLDHFRAGVSAEVDLTSAEQSEETYDPNKSAVLSSQTSEDGPALPTASGVPGTPSNLPRPTATPAVATTTAAAGSANFARKTSSTTYQPSRVVKHTKLPQGTLKKLSLAILVDHTVHFEGNRRIVQAPSAEKLKVVHDLVAASVGFSADRGDQLTVEALPFESTMTAEPPVFAPAPEAPKPSIPLPPWLEKLVGAKNFAIIAGIGAAAMLLLMGGVAFLMLKSRGKKKKFAAEASAALEAAASKELPLNADEIGRQIESRMAEQSALQAKQQAEELMRLKLPSVSTKKTDVLTKHISSEAKKDPTAMAQVVRSWLQSDERR